MIPLARIVVAAICLFAVDARSAEVLILTPAGVTSVALADDGSLVFQSLGNPTIVDLRNDAGGESPDTPDQPKPPVPPAAPDEDLASKAANWADQEDDKAAAGLAAMIYGQVADVVRSGELLPRKASNASRIAADSLLEDWSAFRSKVSSAAAERLATDSLGKPDEMADFLLSISIGVKSVADPVSAGEAIAATRVINAAIDEAKGE